MINLASNTCATANRARIARFGVPIIIGMSAFIFYLNDIGHCRIALDSDSHKTFEGLTRLHRELYFIRLFHAFFGIP